MGRRCTTSSIASLPSIRSPPWRSKVTSAWHLCRCRGLRALRGFKLNERLRPQPPLLLTKKRQQLTSDIHSVSQEYVCLLFSIPYLNSYCIKVSQAAFHEGNSQIIRPSKFLYWIEFCTFGFVRLVERIEATGWGEGRLKEKNLTSGPTDTMFPQITPTKLIMLWNRRIIWP